jgi:DNA-binding transcriptional regulator GbsR (MarR family)
MELSSANRRFVDYFGELGARWGLPAHACRIHACLYSAARPLSEQTLAQALGLDAAQVADGVAFLLDYRMAERTGQGWRTSDDPWAMLAGGLEERRRRELAPALATLGACHREALSDGLTDPAAVRQMGKMLALAESLAALDAQVQRLSPQVLRGLVDVSSRAARFMDRTFGTRRKP